MIIIHIPDNYWDSWIIFNYNSKTRFNPYGCSIKEISLADLQNDPDLYEHPKFWKGPTDEKQKLLKRLNFGHEM